MAVLPDSLRFVFLRFSRKCERFAFVRVRAKTALFGASGSAEVAPDDYTHPRRLP